MIQSTFIRTCTRYECLNVRLLASSDRRFNSPYRNADKQIAIDQYILSPVH